MDTSPSSVIEKNPISPVPPNRFFVDWSSLSCSSFSPSITRTVSTRCSSDLRPAISSFLFICPTSITALGLDGFLAILTIAFAHSIVCVGEPALEGKCSSRVKVCMLSIIIRSGSTEAMCPSTLFMLLSGTTQMFSCIFLSILSALLFIWLSLSSPVA